MSGLEVKLIELGVRPNWLGKTKGGKVLEYLSHPWVAGRDVFVLVQEPGKPETADCVVVWEVRPLGATDAELAA